MFRSYLRVLRPLRGLRTLRFDEWSEICRVMLKRSEHLRRLAEYVDELSARPGAWIYGYVSESECNNVGEEASCGGWSETAILKEYAFDLVVLTGMEYPERAASVVTNADGTFEIELPPGIRYSPGGADAWLPMDGVEPVAGEARLLAVTHYQRE